MSTTAYFDEHCPEYSLARLAWAAEWTAERYGPDASLADCGCGAAWSVAPVESHVAASVADR